VGQTIAEGVVCLFPQTALRDRLRHLAFSIILASLVYQLL
jgi:hypothetical protein